MGGGSYSYIQSKARGAAYQQQSREEVFHQTRMNPEMNIKDKVRESRDSEEHPNSFPIILALDVTGSMGRIPHMLITEGFPEIMKKIMDSGIKDPQVCFVGIGDHYSDAAPIQVGQFESSDDLLDKWLKTIWLEGHGGGNGGESYGLAHFFAANCASTDSMLHRKQKGVLITIGDEPNHLSYDTNHLKQLFGFAPETRVMAARDLIAQAQLHWDVYHINLMDYSGVSKNVQDNWKSLLGDHFINTEDAEGKDIPDLIAGIILKSVGKHTNVNKVSVEDGTVHIR